MKFSDEVVLLLWVTKQVAQKMSHVPTCATGNTGLTIHNSLKNTFSYITLNFELFSHTHKTFGAFQLCN
jgi:hypothetical protein